MGRGHPSVRWRMAACWCVTRKLGGGPRPPTDPLQNQVAPAKPAHGTVHQSLTADLEGHSLSRQTHSASSENGGCQLRSHAHHASETNPVALAIAAAPN